MNQMVKDVCEVFLKDKLNGNVYFLGLTTSSEVTQSLNSEILRAGIGNGVVATLYSDKTIGFNVSTIFHSDDLISMQMGKKFNTGTVTVFEKESVTCTTEGELTIKGTPKTGGKVSVIDKHSEELAEATFASNKVTVAGATVGSVYTVIYPKELTTAKLLTIDDSVPTAYETQLHTIGYDPDTNVVLSDIYWIFDNAVPDGALSQSYSAGANTPMSINFSVKKNVGSESYGKYAVAKRA